MDDLAGLSRRERQIMDIVYALGEASVNEVVDAMHDPPTRTAVRTLIRILEEKGHLKHRKQGRAFIYAPVRPRQRAGISAFQRVIETFYQGSLEEALSAHLFHSASQVDLSELKRLARLIESAKTEAKGPIND